MSDFWNANLYDDKHNYVWQMGAGVLDLLDPQPGELILDLGCGTGHLTARIEQRGAAVIGLDPSEKMLETARREYQDIDFRQDDARTFEFPERFDAIFSNAVLHW
ncbi:class I SAM-dependent methyltransferase, partial [bacterium]